jgi:hypothetical protein
MDSNCTWHRLRGYYNYNQATIFWTVHPYVITENINSEMLSVIFYVCPISTNPKNRTYIGSISNSQLIRTDIQSVELHISECSHVWIFFPSRTSEFLHTEPPRSSLRQRCVRGRLPLLVQYCCWYYCSDLVYRCCTPQRQGKMRGDQLWWNRQTHGMLLELLKSQNSRSNWIIWSMVSM